MHLFFDLDGTLTDPKEGIVSCIQYALSKLQIEVDENIRLETFIGPPLRDVFAELCGDESVVEEAVTLYRDRFSTIGLFENQLYGGIVECLEQLVGKVDSIYVVTSKPTIYSERIVEHFNIGHYFDSVYGSNLDGTLSDKTELIKHVLNIENIDPVEAVMIGDRKFDITGAKNQGVSTIGVLWGYGTEQELRVAGADKMCTHPGQIYAHLFN